MFRNNYVRLVLVLLLTGVTGWIVSRSKKTEPLRYEEVAVFRGPISATVTSMGVIEPSNRLKIQSSVGGRIEKVLVEEGQLVRKGDVIALLSSTERAALLDAARVKGEAESAYWKKVYNETAIVAPLDGQIIVRSIEPGQTVTSNDSLFVLSDKLIVKVFVDETDIGKIKVGQRAMIALDAYPDIRVRGVVDRIHFESELQNNVTIYIVDIVPENIPSEFRSGMSTEVTVSIKNKKRALLLPSDAVQSRKGEMVVAVKTTSSQQPAYRVVRTGMQDDRHIEITGGLEAGDKVLRAAGGAIDFGEDKGANPFMPSRKRVGK